MNYDVAIYSLFQISQPAKKKKFIDKKNAVTFHLVHRSQRDPLQAKEESSKHVLLPVEKKKVIVYSYIDVLIYTYFANQNAYRFWREWNEDAWNTEPVFCIYLKELSKEEKLEELHKYGIFYDDEYDYLQHLKDLNEVYELEEHVPREEKVWHISTTAQHVIVNQWNVLQNILLTTGAICVHMYRKTHIRVTVSLL